ncbi:MAG TPA: cytochrome-c oxidase, cbb3-type subunit II, partial [bacterium]|nr:cytochrome-c oxidase, cbb3-type subunit II [bacterium]
FASMFIMAYNLIKTAKQGQFIANEKAEAPALTKEYVSHGQSYYHRLIERKPLPFIILTLIAVAIGGVLEIVPTFAVESNIPTIASVKPYSPLELQGRDIYIREGCYTCHSQLVRPFRSETERYGEYSKAGEYVYDHPFQWGSKRTGPDLHRVGGKYTNSWHYSHMMDPRAISPGSIMPAYPWLFENSLDISTTEKKISAMQIVGVPYEKGYEKVANNDLKAQATAVAGDLTQNGFPTTPDKEIVALIAYLQRLGTDIKVKQ